MNLDKPTTLHVTSSPPNRHAPLSLSRLPQHALSSISSYPHHDFPSASPPDRDAGLRIPYLFCSKHTNHDPSITFYQSNATYLPSTNIYSAHSYHPTQILTKKNSRL